MKCPTCGHGEHRVLRADAVDGVVRRRRECLSCARRWFTIEAPETVYKRAEDIAEAFDAMKGAVGE